MSSMFFVVSPLALRGRRPHHVDALVRAESQLLVRGKPDRIGVSTWYEALSACLGCRLERYVDLLQARDRQELQPDPRVRATTSIFWRSGPTAVGARPQPNP